MPARRSKTSPRPTPHARTPRRGSSRTRDEKKETTRRRIVAAALALFEAKGFEHTTTKAIAQRAKIAEGTVFNYFPTKDDIALYFFELEVDHAIAVVRQDTKLQAAALEEKLFALIQQQLEYLAPYERFIGTALVQALKPSSTLAFSVQAVALRHRYLAFVDELITESLPMDRVNTIQWIAPSAFWLYYLGVLLYWLHDDSPDKQKTLAFLDQSLRFGAGILRKGTL